MASALGQTPIWVLPAISAGSGLLGIFLGALMSYWGQSALHRRELAERRRSLRIALAAEIEAFLDLTAELKIVERARRLANDGIAEPQEPPPVGGAKINVETISQNGREATIISIEGELVPGDETHFADAAIRAPGAIVMLSSPGGNLLAGIEIGKAIRLKGFSTLVPEGFQCASACALAWLGGSPRFMGRGATIGFHAAFTTENGRDTVSSSANAVVGAYLNQLGLPLQAIAYITEAQPNEIRWLTFDEAERYGIEVRQFPAN